MRRKSTSSEAELRPANHVTRPIIGIGWRIKRSANEKRAAAALERHRSMRDHQTAELTAVLVVGGRLASSRTTEAGRAAGCFRVATKR